MIQFPGLEEVNTAFCTRPEDLISYRADAHTMSITPHPGNEGVLSLHPSSMGGAPAAASTSSASILDAGVHSSASGGTTSRSVQHSYSQHNSASVKPKPSVVHRPDRILRTSVDTTGSSAKRVFDEASAEVREVIKDLPGALDVVGEEESGNGVDV